MAFNQRQKKRRAKTAQAAARAAQRSSGSKSALWWLTIVKRDTCCARCAGMLRVGRPMVYRASPREALCEPCAELHGIKARPSAAWQQARMRKTKVSVSLATARRLIAAGELTKVAVGGSVRVAASDLEALIERGKNSTTGGGA